MYSTIRLYEAPSLAMVTLGTWALTIGREALSGFCLGAVTAIRATPLVFLPYLLLRRRYLACAMFIPFLIAFSVLPDVISWLTGGHGGYLNAWVQQTAGPALLPGHSPNLAYWGGWTVTGTNNQSLRGVVNRLASGPTFGLSPTMILVAVDGVFALAVAALLLISPRDKKYAAIDGAVLLIAMLALSPMTSRYHFVLVLPAVMLVVAAVINDRRMRVYGSVVLARELHVADRHIERPDGVVVRRIPLCVRLHDRGRDRAARGLCDDGANLAAARHCRRKAFLGNRRRDSPSWLLPHRFRACAKQRRRSPRSSIPCRTARRRVPRPITRCGNRSPEIADGRWCAGHGPGLRFSLDLGLQAPMIKSLAAVAPARDNHLLMLEWLRQHRGWITLIVLAAIYYPFFGKGSQGIALYAAAGRCIWHGQALLPCEPMFSYQPALAALMVPIAVLPAALQKLVWYVICVCSLVLTVRLAEAMAERLYPGATHGRNLIWLRTVNLLLCSKYILLVLAYQAYQAPALAMTMLGIWALTVGREASGGFWRRLQRRSARRRSCTCLTCS